MKRSDLELSVRILNAEMGIKQTDGPMTEGRFHLFRQNSCYVLARQDGAGESNVLFGKTARDLGQQIDAYIEGVRYARKQARRTITVCAMRGPGPLILKHTLPPGYYATDKEASKMAWDEMIDLAGDARRLAIIRGHEHDLIGGPEGHNETASENRQ